MKQKTDLENKNCASHFRTHAHTCIITDASHVHEKTYAKYVRFLSHPYPFKCLHTYTHTCNRICGLVASHDKYKYNVNVDSSAKECVRECVCKGVCLANTHVYVQSLDSFMAGLTN